MLSLQKTIKTKNNQDKKQSTQKTINAKNNQHLAVMAFIGYSVLTMFGKLLIVFIVIIALLFAIYPGAERISEYYHEDILIGHPLYFIKQIPENVENYFTVGNENRVKWQLELANKKLAEAKILASKNKQKQARMALDKYHEHVENAEAVALEEKTKDLYGDLYVIKVANMREDYKIITQYLEGTIPYQVVVQEEKE